MEKDSNDIKKNFHNMHYGAEAFGFKNAEMLRKYQTESESVLWEELKSKKLDGFKFRRQHPVGRFVVDFYCHSVKLVIELDGGIHHKADVYEYDKDRQKELEELGLKIIRFTNNELLLNKEKVLNKIRKAIQKINKSN